MTARWWRVLAAILVLALSVGGGVGAAAVGAQEQAETGAPETPDGDPAIDDLVGCVQASQRLLVLFLIDESASLKVSDPDDRRVDAAQSALDSLLALATAEGEASPAVDVSLAAFSNEYRLVQDWTPANAGTAEPLTSALAGFADYESGIDTDFVNALSAGRDSLADRSAQVTAGGGAAPCRAVLMFTDGGFDLAVRESSEDQERLGTTKPYAPGIELTTPEAVKEAERAGRAALCDPDGIADQLRADEVTMLTVALSGGVARRAQLPLAAATTGTADNYTCGTPTERASGAYLPAAGVDVLVARFNEVGTRLAGGNPYPGDDQVKVCGEDPCDEGSRRFTLDQGLRRAQVLALAPKAGATLRLEGPSGETVDITEPGTSKVGETEATAQALAGRGLTVDLERPADPASWDGEWTATLLDPTGDQAGEDATLQVFVFSDLGITLTDLQPLVRGAEVTVGAGITAPEGLAVDKIVTAAAVELRVLDPITGKTATAPMEGPPAGPFTITYPVPATLTANAVDVTVQATLTTSSGAQLVARSAPREVLVQRPAGSIQILPPSLKLPSLTGEGATQGELIFQGGDAAGCVWFGEVSVPTAPDGAAPIELTIDGKPLPAEADCIEVPAKTATTITIEASPAARASGAVRGSFQVFEKVGGAEASTTDLQFRFDLARGVDETQRLLLTVLLLVGGLALPMVLLLVINAVTARFQTLDVVRGTALPVQLSQGVISRTDGAYPRSLQLREADFESLEGLGTTRQFTFGGVVFRAKASSNPFGGTVAMAAPVGGAEKLKGNEGSRVELDPGLAGSWIFLLDAAKTRQAIRGDAHGLLIAFVAEGDVAAQLQKLMPDITARLPQVAGSLAGLVRATRAKPAKQSKAAKGATAAAAPEAPADGDEAEDVEPVEGVEVPAEPTAPVGPTEVLADLPEEAELTPDDFPGGDAEAEAEPAGEAPAAPLGFGGNAAVAATDLPRLPPDDDDGDGGSAAPPTGFTGGR